MSDVMTAQDVAAGDVTRFGFCKAVVEAVRLPPDWQAVTISTATARTRASIRVDQGLTACIMPE